MKARVRSIIVEVLAVAHASQQSEPETAVKVGLLIDACALFGFSANTVRVTLAKMRAEGAIVSAGRGLYALGPQSHALSLRVMRWRQTHERTVLWDGSWVGVYTGHLPRSDRSALRRRTRALRLGGFEALEEGLHLRPNNLTGGVPVARDELLSLGLESIAVVTRVEEMSDADCERARGLWDVGAIAEGYRRLRDELESSLERRSQISIEEAMREAFLLGRKMIRWAALDPMLPEAIAPAAERNAAIQTMIRFDRTGQELWRRYLGIAPTEEAA